MRSINHFTTVSSLLSFTLLHTVYNISNLRPYNLITNPFPWSPLSEIKIIPQIYLPLPYFLILEYNKMGDMDLGTLSLEQLSQFKQQEENKLQTITRYAVGLRGGEESPEEESPEDGSQGY